jgi:hypothetical protein
MDDYCVRLRNRFLSTTMNSILVDGNIWEGRIVPYENSQAAGGALEQCAVTNSQIQIAFETVQI